MNSKEAKPNPGGDEAVVQGCLCPVWDNAHGKGRILNGERVFWQDEKCPLHGLKTEENAP